MAIDGWPASPAPPPRRWKPFEPAWHDGAPVARRDARSCCCNCRRASVLLFAAGQYINILLDDGQRRAFSFANRPGPATRSSCMRLVPGGRRTTHVFDGMAGRQRCFKVRWASSIAREPAPHSVHRRATGLRPSRASSRTPLRVACSARCACTGRAPSRRLVRCSRWQWQREHDNFTVVPVVSEPTPEDGWSGRTGLVHEAMLADFQPERQRGLSVRLGAHGGDGGAGLHRPWPR